MPHKSCWRSACVISAIRFVTHILVRDLFLEVPWPPPVAYVHQWKDFTPVRLMFSKVNCVKAVHFIFVVYTLYRSSWLITNVRFRFSGILVIISLMFCTPYLYYIPKTALAAIIIAAVIFMVEVRVVRPIYRSKSKLYILPTFFFFNNN